MSRITAPQRQQIAALREKNVSFRQIAKQLAMPLGSVTTCFYSGRPAATVPVVKARNGQFKSAAPRQGPGRKPLDGVEARSDKERAADCRARKRERMVQLAGNLSDATDTELVAMLAQAIRTGDTSMVNGIVIELHTRHCAKT